MNKPRILIGIIAIVGSAMNVAHAGDYFNGFEADDACWFSATRVASGAGTLGVTSATGGWHAEASSGAFTRWGGYGDGVGCVSVAASFPANGYDTSIDIYLDVDGGWDNHTLFDFSSAVSRPDNTHLQDFIFNCGFYNDDTNSGANGTPGAGDNRFICSANSNSQPGSAFAKNPGFTPTVVATTSGWYTFRHQFRDDGFGRLTVDLSVLNAGGTVIQTWTILSGIIGTDVGGNRYGWFDYSEFSALAIDNTLRTSIASVPSLSCVGTDTSFFNAPLDVPVTVNKRARALPFSMMLVDEFGNALTDADIAPPMIVIGVTPGEEPSSEDPPAELESAGKGEDGNLFSFNGMKWGFNLKTKNFSGAGKYTATVVSSDPSVYVVSPTCEGNFYITR